MRYKKYHINLESITKSNYLPDLQSIHSNVLEGNEYLKKETMPDGIVIYRAASLFSQLIIMHLPEDHPAFNFDVGVISCNSCYVYDNNNMKRLYLTNKRFNIFKYIIHPLFNSISKK